LSKKFTAGWTPSPGVPNIGVVQSVGGLEPPTDRVTRESRV
jgi:hypothetical protein